MDAKQVENLTLSYSPLYAQHVKGRYEKRVLDPDTKRPAPQRVVMVCEVCRAVREVECRQGMPRQHISRFAQVLLHRGSFAKQAVMQ